MPVDPWKDDVRNSPKVLVKSACVFHQKPLIGVIVWLGIWNSRFKTVFPQNIVDIQAPAFLMNSCDTSFIIIAFASCLLFWDFTKMCWFFSHALYLVSPFVLETWTFILLKEASFIGILVISSSPCSLFLLPKNLSSWILYMKARSVRITW